MDLEDASAEDLRLRAKVINERTKLISIVSANGGLALIAAGVGFLWSAGLSYTNALMVFVGVIVILVGVGLLDFMRSEE